MCESALLLWPQSPRTCHIPEEKQVESKMLLSHLSSYRIKKFNLEPLWFPAFRRENWVSKIKRPAQGETDQQQTDSRTWAPTLHLGAVLPSLLQRRILWFRAVTQAWEVAINREPWTSCVLSLAGGNYWLSCLFSAVSHPGEIGSSSPQSQHHLPSLQNPQSKPRESQDPGFSSQHHT